MTSQKTSLLFDEVARLEAMGDLYGYDSEIGRTARKTLAALLLWFALIALAGSQSCRAPGEVQARPDAYAIR